MLYPQADVISAQALTETPRLRTMLEYYTTLADQLGRRPTRLDIDPIEFYPALPSTALVELHRADGRLRFRIVGQDILERLGVAGLGGRWLDQVVALENGDAVDALFSNVIATQAITFEPGEVHRRKTRTVTAYSKLVLPLAACEGEPETALVGIVFTEPVNRPRRY